MKSYLYFLNVQSTTFIPLWRSSFSKAAAEAPVTSQGWLFRSSGQLWIFHIRTIFTTVDSYIYANQTCVSPPVCLTQCLQNDNSIMEGDLTIRHAITSTVHNLISLRGDLIYYLWDFDCQSMSSEKTTTLKAHWMAGGVKAVPYGPPFAKGH